MQLKSVVLATMLAVGASSAYAGNFVTLGSGVSNQLSVANGGLVSGATNSSADKLYIENTSATYLAGYDGSSNGEVVASTINYRAFTGSTTTATGTLTLLDWRVTNNVDLSVGSAQANIFDFVYRDSLDNSLVFGTRYMNQVDNNEEANYLYRYGFSGYSAASAWTFVTDSDLRMYQIGLTSSAASTVSVAYDADVVRQKGDFSLSEGNPWSGLFLVKTNATSYELGNSAIGYFQAGEEGQAKVGGSIAGFVAADLVAAVPEPETYAMFLAGLGLMGFMARRRREEV